MAQARDQRHRELERRRPGDRRPPRPRAAGWRDPSASAARTPRARPDGSPRTPPSSAQRRPTRQQLSGRGRGGGPPAPSARPAPGAGARRGPGAGWPRWRPAISSTTSPTATWRSEGPAALLAADDERVERQQPHALEQGGVGVVGVGGLEAGHEGVELERWRRPRWSPDGASPRSRRKAGSATSTPRVRPEDEQRDELRPRGVQEGGSQGGRTPITS